MSVLSRTPTNDNGVLPQHGFSADTDFTSLLAGNPFLFRVYTPRERSPFFDDTDPYFLAPKFNEEYVRSPVEFKEQHLIDGWEVAYSDVAKHMDWTTRAASPFISTSFSFAWCIWDALRRFHQGVKKDVQVAIIDGRAVAERAKAAIELLELSSPSERTKEYSKWHRFSQESQSVLVYGSIPGTAVLASIPLLSILRHMPSYFFKPGSHTLNTENPLSGIGWDYTEKKSSYRRFCRDMSSRFYGLTTEEQLADTTAGSLALAMAFLRPWFHQTVDLDGDQAIQTLTALASIIAQWPGQQWVREHPEIHDLLHAMASTLCQELRQQHGLRVKNEVSRLQGIVDELHDVVRDYQVKLNSFGKRPMANRPRKPLPALFINSSVPVFIPRVNVPSPSPSHTTTTPPSSVIKVQTPLTPPDTPKSSSFVNTRRPRILTTSAEDNAVDPFLQGTESKSQPAADHSPLPPPLSAAIVASINAIANQSLSPSEHHDISDISVSPKVHLSAQPKSGSIALTPPLIHPERSHTPPPSSALSEIRPEEIPLPPTPLQHGSMVSGNNFPEYPPLPSPLEDDDDDSWTVILSQTGDLDSEDDADEDDDTQIGEDGSYRKELQDSLATLRDQESSPPGSPTLVIAPLPEPGPSGSGSKDSKDSDALEYVPPRPLSGIFADALEIDFSQVDLDDERFVGRRPPRMLETAGCLITGFLVGAFITASIFSPQRRMLILLT